MRLARVAPIVVAVLALRAPAARAEPLDLDMAKLGAPDAQVWINLGPAYAANAQQLSVDAKQRFAILSTEVALAVSGPLLQPASTTGHSGFDVAFEGGYSTVHDAPVGTAPPGDYSARPWSTKSVTPAEVWTSGVHVRKSLPFSFELGGRLTYLAQSSYLAAQGEAKWALNEGFDYIPDLAVRLAYTSLFGQKDWNLGATDLDFLVSKRWGVNAVTSFTPYVAARFTFVQASSEMMQFGTPGPSDPPATVQATTAKFPNLDVGVYRTTLGLRLTAYAVSLAGEVTYFGGTKYHGKATPAADEYGSFEVASTFSGAFRLGWEF